MKRHFPKELSKNGRRKVARRRFNRLYNERIFNVGKFVAACIPALSERESITLKDLRKLFYANHFSHYSYQTYAGNAAERGAWMSELIEKYDAFYSKPRTNAVILFTVSPEHPFNENDRQVAELTKGLCSGQTALLIKNDDRLGEELQLDVAFYEM